MCKRSEICLVNKTRIETYFLDECGAIIISDTSNITMEEESCPIFQVGQDNFRELNQDYADQPIPITLSYNCELPNQEILAYGGFAVAWLALVIWWLIITLFVNSKNAVFLHKAITIIPVLKFLELLCQVQYWSQSCEAGELELLYSLLVYGQLYESAFFILIFALSNGIILAKQAFRGIELVLFLLVAGGSLVMELMYNEELHRFNLPVFGVLCILFLLGVVRTIYSLKSQFQAIAKYEKVQYFIIYRRKLYIYFWFVLILILFCTL